MDRHHNDNNDRLRSILKKMARSIDDARTRRITGDEDPLDSPIAPSAGSASDRGNPGAFNPLDTRIADSRPVDSSSDPEPVRDRETMFDFDGPRLKARPKRRSAG